MEIRKCHFYRSIEYANNLVGSNPEIDKKAAARILLAKFAEIRHGFTWTNAEFIPNSKKAPLETALRYWSATESVRFIGRAAHKFMDFYDELILPFRQIDWILTFLSSGLFNFFIAYPMVNLYMANLSVSFFEGTVRL